MSSPSLEHRGSSARPRDRRFYQAVRPPRRDLASPGTPADPAVEPAGASRTVDGRFPGLRVFGDGPAGHGPEGCGPRPGEAPEGEPEATESLGVPARSLPRAPPILETSERPRRSRPGPRRAAFAARASRLLDARLEFVDHPSFDDPAAHDRILGPSPEPGGQRDTRRGKSPETPRPRPAGSCESPLLSREQEAHLFHQMNYLKSLARRLRDRIDPARARAAELDEIERLLTEATTVRNRIIEANLRLVVSIAKEHARPEEDLSELVSDGNVALIRAVDRFDFARGNKFSTYASWAIINGLRRRNRRKSVRVRFVPGNGVMLQSAADTRAEEYDREKAQGQYRLEVERLLGRLDDRERRIIAGRYGIGGAGEKTQKQIGKELGICKERVRQLESRAEGKLRQPARAGALDLLLA
jgi:RNA polymerase primary sigma factor